MLNYAVDKSANGLHFSRANRAEYRTQNRDGYFQNHLPINTIGAGVLIVFFHIC